MTRITYTFEVEVEVEVEVEEEIDFDQTVERFTNSEEMRDKSWYLREAEHNKRLLHELLDDHELSEEYFKALAHYELVEALREGERARDEESDKVLKKIIRRLPDDSRKHFAEAIENNVLWESTNFFFDTYEAWPKSMSIDYAAEHDAAA